MSSHKYISERFEKRTYIKGKFKGKFVGQLDEGKSTEKFERFFDLEILEGDILTSQDNVKKWTEEQESGEFVKVSTFTTKLPGEMRVTLNYLDGSVKYFKIKLRELKLINCRLSKQVHKNDEVYGVIEGDISGYLLHYDTVINEIVDLPKRAEPLAENTVNEEKIDNPVKPVIPVKDVNKKTPPTIYDPKQKTGCFSFLSTLFLITFIAGIFIASNKWFFYFLMIIAACFALPKVYNWLTRFFNFRLSRRRAIVLYTFLFLITLAFLTGTYQANKYELSQSQAFAQQRQKTSDQSAKETKQQKDSFERHFNSAKALLQRHKKNEALKSFERAALFASESDKKIITAEITKIYVSVAADLVKKENYNEAIEVYSSLVRSNLNNADYLYKRAECYLATDHVREAVTDLRQAVNLGDKAAMLLHEKINPIKKRVVDYVTRCCDGSTSNAKGQGACSHHGGVCDWNEPVYEEYRQY